MLIAKLGDVDCPDYHLSFIAGIDPYWGAMILRKQSPWLKRMNFEVTYRMPYLQHMATMRNQSLCMHRLINNEVLVWMNVFTWQKIFHDYFKMSKRIFLHTTLGETAENRLPGVIAVVP